MPERSIADLLGELPRSVAPDPALAARLRSCAAAELRGSSAAGPSAFDLARPSTQPSITEVIELQTITRPTNSPDSTPPSRQVWRAAAIVLLTGGVVAAAVVVMNNDSPDTIAPQTSGSVPATAPATTPVTSPVTTPGTSPVTTPAAVEAIDPASSFAAATVDHYEVDFEKLPYFVGATDEPWIGSLAGELRRLDPTTGDVLAVAQVSESSPFVVDANAVWVVDAITGNVVRLDPDSGAIVAEIPTGVEIIGNSVRRPMLPGALRDFAAIGGIATTGDSIWVGDRSGSLLRIDPVTNTIVGSLPVDVTPDHIRADGAHLLAARLGNGDVAVLNADTGAVVQQFLGRPDLAGAELFGGALYMQDAATGTVTRVDLATGEQITSEPFGASAAPVEANVPTGLVVTPAGVVIAVDSDPDSVHVLDPGTLAEIGTLPVSADGGDITVAGDGSVWLVRHVSNEVLHLTPPAS